MRLILIGPPGAGKGTQAAFIGAHFAIPAISTGDIFRSNVKDETELGVQAKQYMDAGDLVPDELTIAMVADRISQPDAEKGFLLDGFPRTTGQAEALEAYLADHGEALDVVLELAADHEEVVRRLSGRRICRDCGRTWHTDYDPPAKDGVCDSCGGELFRRDDDAPATVRRRLEVYDEQTAPLVGHYRELGLLHSISAEGSVEEVTARALAAIEAVD